VPAEISWVKFIKSSLPDIIFMKRGKGPIIEPVPILLISSFNGQTGNHLAMSIRPSASKLSSLFAF